MKKTSIFITLIVLIVSCTSNTIYEKPKNLIPKDTMVSLLTDMYIASSAKNHKNKFLKREKNYVFLVYDKYKIDSTRFDISNAYYTSKIDEYSDILKLVKKRIDSLFDTYEEEYVLQDSIKQLKKDSLLLKKRLKKEMLKEEELPGKLLEKNEKLMKKERLKNTKS